MRLRHTLVWGGLLSLLSACSLWPKLPPPPRMLDFGPPHGRHYHGPMLPPLAFAGLKPGVGMAGRGIHYRLLYHHPHELRVYPQVAWLGSPIRLLNTRLRNRFSALSREGAARYVLKLTLSVWEEDFTSPQSARVRMAIDATLARPLDQDWQIHHIFILSQRAPPGVSGAVAGFASLDHAFDRALTIWVAQKTRSGQIRVDPPHEGVSTRSR